MVRSVLLDASLSSYTNFFSENGKKIRWHAPRDLTNQNVLFVEQKWKQPQNVLIFRAWKEPFSEVYIVKFSLYSKLV